MTDDRIALRELLEKGSDATFLREMIEPLRVCRRLQPLRGWSDERSEDSGELFA